MSKIFVAPLSGIHELIADHAPSHLVTLLGPEYMIDTPAGIAEGCHLKLAVNDIVEANAGDAPSAAHVRDLLGFARSWSAQSPMIVHCWAGISRSMAATFTILCDRTDASEREIAQTMRRLAPHADPNRLFVRIADDLLGRSGRMVDAIDSIGRGKLTAEGCPVAFPLVIESA